MRQYDCLLLIVGVGQWVHKGLLPILSTFQNKKFFFFVFFFKKRRLRKYSGNDVAVGVVKYSSYVAKLQFLRVAHLGQSMTSPKLVAPRQCPRDFNNSTSLLRAF